MQMKERLDSLEKRASVPLSARYDLSMKFMTCQVKKRVLD